MIRDLLARALGATAALFYRVERAGQPYPPGPLVVAANHPNALLDPLMVFLSAGRLVQPLAKAPLFSHPVIGVALRALGGLPVFRRQDDPDLMDRNDRTFEAAIAALAGGGAIQIFPEGQSHSGSELAPLKTGAARIALQAEAAHGWRLGVKIVPVGLTYARKTFFRGDALALVGEANVAGDLRSAYERDPAEAVRDLTAHIEGGLRAVTVNLPTPEERRLVDTAERIWAREKGAAAWRERAALGDRVPRLQAFASGLAWLGEHAPERRAALAARVARYRRIADALGAGDAADIPARTGPLQVLHYVVVRVLPLVAAAALAGLGAAFWVVPYLVPRAVLRFADLREDEIATWKLVPAALAYPVTYAAWLFLAWRAGGPAAAAAAAVVLPALGVIAIAWREGIRAASEDARLFLRSAGRKDTIARLVAEREALVAEFDAVAERAGIG